jgi:hypothetical protein
MKSALMNPLACNSDGSGVGGENWQSSLLNESIRLLTFTLARRQDGCIQYGRLVRSVKTLRERTSQFNLNIPHCRQIHDKQGQKDHHLIFRGNGKDSSLGTKEALAVGPVVVEPVNMSIYSDSIERDFLMFDGAFKNLFEIEFSPSRL